MFHEFTVPIPKLSGKILLKRQRDYVYVHYEIERLYNAEKKYNVPKRVVIGRVSSTNESLMHPNEKFLTFFPETVIPAERASAYRSCALKIGSHLVIESIVKTYGLDDMLRKWFGSDAGLVLDLASFFVVSEDNAAQHYPSYAFNRPLFSEGMVIFSDTTISRFLKQVSKEQIFGFLNDWNAKQDHRQRIYVSYDSTNKNSQAGDIDLVEYGKPKDDKGLPIVNLAIAYDKSNEVPLFYEEYPGSINDVSQLRYLVDKIDDYNYRSVGFILDRGYFSRENIAYMDQKGHPFVIMVKGRKKLVSSIIEANYGKFETSCDAYIKEGEIHGMTTRCPLFVHDSKQRYFHLYFVPGRMSSERKAVQNKIQKMQAIFQEYEGKEIEFGAPYTNYFDCHYANKDGKKVFVYASMNKDIIEEELKLCGYFSIVTSEKMTAKEAYVLYQGRDASEKLFRADKTFLGAKSARIHSNEAAAAKTFIGFIALIIRNRIYRLLKEEMLRMQTKRNYMSVPAAMLELEKIEMVRRTKNGYRLDHAVTRTQKTILQSFGLSEEDVKAKAVELANVLAKAPEQILEQDQEDEEDGSNEIDVFA